MRQFFKTKFITSIIAAGIIAATAGNVFAASPARCGDRKELVNMIEKKFKEHRVAYGLSQKSTEAFEFFASKKGTWTAMMTMNTGQTCIMATGHSWETLELVAGHQT